MKMMQVVRDMSQLNRWLEILIFTLAYEESRTGRRKPTMYVQRIHRWRLVIMKRRYTCDNKKKLNL